MKTTGFTAYCCYLFIKNIHFKDNDVNIMNIHGIPMKDKLINSWNKKRRKQDGVKFREIENECKDIKSLAFLYSSYYIKNPNFYIQDIFEDTFDIFQKNSIEILYIDELFINDLKEVLNFCREEQLTPQKLFYAKTEIPKIFKLNISFNSLVILNEVFNVVEQNKDIKINPLEEGKWETLKISLVKYKLIIESQLDKYNWKQIIKEVINER